MMLNGLNVVSTLYNKYCMWEILSTIACHGDTIKATNQSGSYTMYYASRATWTWYFQNVHVNMPYTYFAVFYQDQVRRDRYTKWKEKNI